MACTGAMTTRHTAGLRVGTRISQSCGQRIEHSSLSLSAAINSCLLRNEHIFHLSSITSSLLDIQQQDRP